jgi:hypothetical protein
MEKPVKEEKAKQGRWGMRLFIVLVVGTVLAVIALWGAARYNNATTPREPGKTLLQGQ